MIDTTLPKRIEAARLAKEASTVSGSILVSENKFQQLRTIVEDIVAPVEYSFSFFRDMEGFLVLRGNCKTKIKAACERCLECVIEEVNSEFLLGMIFSDEKSQHLPKIYEPLLLDSKGCCSPWKLLEDELILALPMYINHPLGQCVIAQPYNEPESAFKRENPFSVLKNLK